MLKSFLAASCFVSLVACVKQDEAPSGIERALPTSEQVSIKLPEQHTRAIGQLANWYVATHDITRTFNGGTGWVLVLLHTIVKFPVTTVSGDTYTWGPWSEPLDPAEYKLDVHANGDGTYSYQLSGRSKTTANATFEVVIDGTADPRKGDLQGNGNFLLDFDASRRVNPLDNSDAKGTLDVRYDLSARHLDLTIMSTDIFGQPALADYAYNESDTGGDMTLGFSSNVGGGPALESATLHSRWLDSGAGRADGLIGGGDLGALQATASECWDGGFKRVFYTDSVTFSATEGLETSCAFATADVPAPK
ncbi:MAG: hypothetical protein ABIY55_21705 [Kofleriaceae bacterium]